MRVELRENGSVESVEGDNPLDVFNVVESLRNAGELSEERYDALVDQLDRTYGDSVGETIDK